MFDDLFGSDAVKWSALLAAPFVGSFLGVIIRRLPDDRTLAWGRSHCEHCGRVLAVRDLVPVVSWLAAGGRCRYCRQPLGWFYPGIEIAAVVVALLALAADGGERTWLDCVFGWWLLALGWIDLRRWLLPDALTLPLIVAGLALAAAFAREELSDRALGAVLGYLGLRAIALIYRAVRRREGLGQGDAKLLAAAGAWVGASALPQVVFGAALSALVTVVALRLAGVRLGAHSALPFGPFLAIATWLIWLFGGVLMWP
jgi:leader peptidase (prepilin peptidase) / N-methyltransferase